MKKMIFFFFFSLLKKMTSLPFASIRTEKGKVPGYLNQYHINNANQQKCILPVTEGKFTKDQMNRDVLHFPQGVAHCKDPQIAIDRENESMRKFLDADSTGVVGKPYTPMKYNYRVVESVKDSPDETMLPEIRQLSHPNLIKNPINLSQTKIEVSDTTISKAEKSKKTKIQDTESEMLRNQQERVLMDVEEQKLMY